MAELAQAAAQPIRDPREATRVERRDRVWLVAVPKRPAIVDDSVREEAVSNLGQLVDTVLALTHDAPEDEWWFRGHARGSWALVPSLYRVVPSVSTGVETEGLILREFDNRSRVVAERAGTGDAWELLFLMQHHRVPTRLLDWSRNLLIGAYFAVTDPLSWQAEADPPCVFVFNPKQWNSKVVGPAGMTVAGPSGVMGELDEGTMRSYKPRRSGTPEGPPQEHALAIAGPEFAARIVAQRGAFTVFGTLAPGADRSLEDQESMLAPDPSTLAKVRLDGDRALWRRSLRLVGIGEYTAFPDLDGLARELRGRYFES